MLVPFPNIESSNKQTCGADTVVALLAAVQKRMHLAVAW